MTSDGFKYYGRVLWRHLGHACVHGQVIKMRRNDRVTRVERKLVIGSKKGLEEALLRSEDSEKLNTSFIERLNLSIRRACAYLAGGLGVEEAELSRRFHVGCGATEHTCRAGAAVQAGSTM